ncbi:epidermal growth factor receptor kinase substrate 8-like protein 3 [Dromiciops gliroides]|uniref:epidermal growth factor receptor kinase substrate 8-like protein 3 n=1 Tax=Dromiciops gliroides TaxID=33562 RepID=UPI001CC68115|nr:epidermal growth factor receptor kinase substrate 8-like protein 3 [Dromiciops gliroides]
MEYAACNQNQASALRTTSMDYEHHSTQPFHLYQYPESQTIKTLYQMENHSLARDMEILIHVKNDITTFVEKVVEKVNIEKQPKVWLPVPQYIDYFQKIKYAFNLLGKMSSSLEESKVHGLVYSLFQSLEYVTYHCPDYKTLPKQVSCPLLTDEAIKLLNMNLGQKYMNYWKELGVAWTVTRNSWPQSEPMPPAYIPIFYDGWQLPEITHLEPVKGSAQSLQTWMNYKS